MPDSDAPVLRRQFALPAADTAFLDGLGLPWETVVHANQNWLIVRGERVPDGYNHTHVDVAILIAPGYPPGPLDMAYFEPHLVRPGGLEPHSASSRVDLDGKAWQGWSRHRIPANAWVEGEDDLQSHYFYMRSWLTDELRR